MKLHEDKFAFLNIINLIHEDSSIRADILEKDYYVTLLLRELAGKQVTLPAYFKGGTALYKACLLYTSSSKVDSICLLMSYALLIFKNMVDRA